MTSLSTSNLSEGTGLGLSMSHDIIVKQHGGSIDFETEPGLFTEFKNRIAADKPKVICQPRFTGCPASHLLRCMSLVVALS
jgi:K+-sensing histidine kinase KdpD